MEKFSIKNIESPESSNSNHRFYKTIEDAKNYIKKMGLTGAVSLVCTLGIFSETQAQDKNDNVLLKQSNLELFNDVSSFKKLTENILKEKTKDDTYYKYKIESTTVDKKELYNNNFHGKDITINENKDIDTLKLGDIEASNICVITIASSKENQEPENFYSNFSADVAFKEIKTSDDVNVNKKLNKEILVGYGSTVKEAIFSAISESQNLECTVVSITDTEISLNSTNDNSEEKNLFKTVTLLESNNVLYDAVVIIKKTQNNTLGDSFKYTATLSFNHWTPSRYSAEVQPLQNIVI